MTASLTAPATTRGEKGADYTARHLLVLEGLEAVRKRPGMDIGSTDRRGLMHCVWEIIDNSVDEALAGFGSRIEVVMTKLHAGGQFGGGSYAASGGLHGVGASVVNALSSRLDVEVDRDGSTHSISFRRGVPGGPSSAVALLTPPAGLVQVAV